MKKIANFSILPALLFLLMGAGNIQKEIVIADESNATLVAMVLDSSQVYTVVDKMPELVGGLPALYDHLVYPKTAADNGVEGRVFVRFIVDEKGNVTEPTVLKDIGAGCGEEAVRALKEVKFTPGLVNNAPVKVFYTLPITFKIDS